MKKRMETIYQFDAIFDPNGVGYTVTVPKLPGLVTEGDSLKEAREMVKDAIRCYLESVLKEKAMEVFPKTRLRERIKVTA
ncbi:MAG: type II toxin-antitoxin system HicB family antitoxin [Patescibacteria group bacterium]